MEGMRLVLALLLCAAPARALWFGPRAKSAAPSKPVTLDCDESDWDQRSFDDSDGITYGFANDGRYLFVVYIPHTRMAKFQLSGGYRQSFTIWVYPGAKIRKTAGFMIYSPGSGGPMAMQPIGAASELDGQAVAALPLADRRSVLEARIPLRDVGVSPGQTIAVGVEAGPPDHPPAKPVVDLQHPQPQETFSPIGLWVRVRLAKAAL